MKIHHYQSDPKESPTAQSLVQGEINALVSFWPDICNDASIAPDVAFDILATWAHLQRFAPDTLDDRLVFRLKLLVESDQNSLCEHVLNFPFPTGWDEAASQLDDAWDFVSGDIESEELDHAISEHFELLDRWSLVAYAIAKLKSQLCSDKRFLSAEESLCRAEDFLAEQPDIFLPTAVYASSMLDSYRHELHEFDEELWETTLKHRTLQELIDEQENPSQLNAIPKEVLKELIRISEASDGAVALPESQNTQKLFGELAETSTREVFSAYRISPTNSMSTFVRTNEARFANQRNSIDENSLTIAGSASSSEVDSRFRHITYKVDGDPLVTVRLEERLDADGKPELVVALIGTTSEAQKYSSVEIEFDLESTALTRNATFLLEDAIIQIGADEAKAKIRSIKLSDISNNLRQVIEG